jgi:hypothetical protein
MYQILSPLVDDRQPTYLPSQNLKNKKTKQLQLATSSVSSLEKSPGNSKNKN